MTKIRVISAIIDTFWSTLICIYKEEVTFRVINHLFKVIFDGKTYIYLSLMYTVLANS